MPSGKTQKNLEVTQISFHITNSTFRKECLSYGVNCTNQFLFVFLFSIAVSELLIMQQEFTDKVELALSWMHAIQGRLKANDSTQGPRDALEARLRETEVRYLAHCLTQYV